MGPDTALPDLLASCAGGGGEPAWAEFTSRFHRVIAATVVKTLLSARVQTSGTADDLIQEVYIKLSAHDRRALREFQGVQEVAFHAFLRRISYNVVQDFLRGRKNRPAGPLSEELPAAEDDPHFRLLVAQMLELLDKALPADSVERDKAIFLLYFRDGLSAREIAGLPAIALGEKGVESAVLRMVRLLRGLMGGKPKGTSTA